jgi:hypothetical protein
MSTFGSCSLSELGDLRAELKELAGKGASLRESCGVFVDRLFGEFNDALVLARLYATVPFEYLGEREQSFARRIASQRNLRDELGPGTLVVTLLASRGRKAEWNDPHNSRMRLAVPLLDNDSFQAIPLIGRLLGETKLGVPWLEKQETLVKLEASGGMSQLIFVDDASTRRSSDGRLVVPDQDFVTGHGVRTVLVLGGSYLNGSVIVLILFTSESITEEQSARFTPLINTIKAATMKLVMSGRMM